MQCRIEGCGETFDTIAQVSAHYREAHPGQRSGGKDSERKRRERETRRRAKEAEAAAAAQPEPLPEEPPADPEPGEPEVGPAVAERAPEVHAEPRGKGWRDRVWGGRQSRGSAGENAPRTKERPPRRKRESTAGLFEMAWGGIGGLLIRTGADPGVGTCMQLQVTVAGPILEDATRDTFVDQLLQPIAGRLDKLEAVWALFAVPVLVGVIERGGPEAAVALEPMLRAALRTQLAAMVPVLRKRRAEEEKWKDVVAELVAEGQAVEGLDPVDAVLAVIFAPPAEPAPEPPPGTDDGNGQGGYDPSTVAGTFVQ